MTYFHHSRLDVLPPKEAYSLIRKAVERALALDDGFVEARILQSSLRRVFEYDWSGAGLDHLAQYGLPVHALGPELFYGGRVGASVLVLHAGAASWRAMV